MKVRLAWIAMLAIGCSGSKSAADIDRDDATATPADAAVATADAGTRTPPPQARDEHAVFSLVDNRHGAHRYVDGELVVDAADVAFARYTRFGQPSVRWQLGQSVDGVRAAVAERVAAIEVPLDAKMARGIDRIVLRVHGKAGQTLALRFNGRRPTNVAKTSRVDLADGWQTIKLPIEPGRLGIGENQIGFELTGAKGQVALAWLRLASRPSGDDDPRGAAVFDAKANTVALAKNAALLWYVTIPDGAHLVADVTAGCTVEVQAIAGDDSFAGGKLVADSRRVDLTPMGSRVVGLLVTARECAKATITAPEIRVHGPPPTARATAAAPRYVLLWVMDALRADKIPTFTPGARAQTPNLTELAKTSTIFRQFYTQGNESQTAHASLWTGLYPAVHGVRLGGSGMPKLDPKYDVLAAKLADAGLTTLAVTANGLVTADNGYARGFKEFRNPIREAKQPNAVVYGDKMLALALQRFDPARDKPTYLFFGTMDTHGPWIARKPWIDTYSPGPYDGPFKEYGTAKDLGITPDSMGCTIVPPPADIERLRAIYDSAVSYQDALVGQLVDQLKSWGIWDQTMLIITSDHGEELFEDRRCGHGSSLRDSLIRVPMLIHDPARFPAGTVVDEGAETIDIMPTILAALGQPAVPAAQGASLAPLAQGIGRGWAQPSYTSMYEVSHAMRIGRWKIRVGPAGVPSILDMVADPEERIDLAATRFVERRMLTDNLGVFLALRTQWKKAEWGVTTNVSKAGAAALDKARTP